MWAYYLGSYLPSGHSPSIRKIPLGSGAMLQLYFRTIMTYCNNEKLKSKTRFVKNIYIKVTICLNDSNNKKIHLITTLQPMCSLQPPRPPGRGSSNRQGPCIVSQLAHAERFSQKNTHLRYFVEHIPWQQLFCFCEWQLTDNSMWAAKIFPLHCLSPKLITVRLRWQRNQRQDGKGVGVG